MFHFLLLAALTAFGSLLCGAPHADISFLVADLKYSEGEGVKICEIQPGSLSKFSGYDYISNAEGLAAKGFCDTIERYRHPVWFVRYGICDPKMKKEYLKRGYIEKKGLKEIVESKEFKTLGQSVLYNPYRLSSYAGIVYTSTWMPWEVASFLEKYPAMLVLDRAFLPFFRDKEKMSLLFLDEPELSSIKPRWKAYSKKYTPDLAQEILMDIGTDKVVIKPKTSTKGHGVLIVSAEDLDAVLKQLFYKNGSHVQSKEEEFLYWVRDNSSKFIVEAFYEGDPVSAPQFGNGKYDPTMRVVFFLIYDDEKVEVAFVQAYWILPKISLEREGSLTRKHKSYPEIPNFLEVDPQVLEQVYAILREKLALFYKRALGIDLHD